MPRQAHGRALHPTAPKTARKRQHRTTGLNALELAERENTDVPRIAQHRLGEIEEDSDDHGTRYDADDRSNKRRKVNDTRSNDQTARSLDENDAAASGSDDEGGRWHEGIEGSDEDSDIDSDEAFGESDDERFAHFTFRGSGPLKPKGKVQNAIPGKATDPKISLDEDDGWQDAAVFNDGDDDQDHALDVTDEAGWSDDDEEEDDLGDEAVDLATALEMNLEEERKDVERSAQLKSKRGPTKRAAGSSTDSDSESADADTESELSISDGDDEGDLPGLKSFIADLEPSSRATISKTNMNSRALPSTASSFGVGSSKVSASDLLQFISDPAQRQSLKLVRAAERDQGKNLQGGIPGKLSAPLAKRQQDKLDRAAAYGKSKETLSRWVETVKANRRAEHVSFPLTETGSMGAKSTRVIPHAHHSVPQNDLEATIQNILVESGAASGNHDQLEDQETAFEQLLENDIPLEEIRERRAQLRLTRELMFREEIRAKRIKKIKSKAYRRVHRKERDKVEAQQREQLAAAGLLNSDEEKEKNDRRRAEERMGARHKESRWAKSVKQTGRATWDEEARLEVSDLARRDEELRQRMEGKHINGEDLSDSPSDSDETDSAMGDRLEEQLGALEAAKGQQTSKLGSMLFMQRAEAARRAQNDEELRQIRQAIAEGDEKPADNGEGETEMAGRQSYGISNAHKQPVAKPVRSEMEALLSEDESVDVSTTHTSNIPDGKLHPQQNSMTSKSDFAPQKSRTSSSRQTGNGQTNDALSSRDELDGAAHVLREETSPSESEDEVQTPSNADDSKAALAASIFAGSGDAARNFDQEKKQVVREEEDQVIDNTLPGWGSWTGSGIGRREKRKGVGRFLTTIKGVAADQRQDARLERVIINEKRVKKNGKYLATELPYPFETKQQYERSLRLPMGPEWSTVKHYQDAIKPRLLLKQGTIIKPMAKPIV